MTLKDVTLTTNTTWQGNIIIDGTVKTARKTTLRIEPGTTIRFVYHDRDQDGLGDSNLVIEGRLIAEGTPTRPISFISAANDPKPGDWLELRIDHSPEAKFSNVLISHSTHSIHAHFTKITITNSVISNNIDGCRLGESKGIIQNNLVERNLGKGLNYRNSAVEISNNIIRNNRTGIFIFENNRHALIEHNNIVGNTIGIRMGDFYQGDIAVSENWWGTVDSKELERLKYDHQDDETIGTITISPSPGWLKGAGPQSRIILTHTGEFHAEGFIDASPIRVTQADNTDAVLVASWDGTVSLLDFKGDLRWQTQLGDIIDSSPLVTDNMIIVQSWRPEVVALDRTDGSILWRTPIETSPQDDHRQGGAALLHNTIFVPSWNGTVYGIDQATGNITNRTDLGAPLRSTPLIDGARMYIASGSGTLTALTKNNTIVWQREFKTPLLSSPISTDVGIALCNKSGTVRMIDRADGSTIWQQELREIVFYSAPLVADGALVISTTGGSLWKLDLATGEIIWRQPLSAPSYATTSKSNNLLIVGNNSGEVELFDPRSGRRIASVKTEDAVQGSPLVIGKRLFVGSRDKRLHIYDIKNIDTTDRSENTQL